MGGVRQYGATKAIREETEAEYNRLLDDSVDVAERTEEIGGATLDKLAEQRGQIHEASARASSLRGVTALTDATLREISWRRTKKEIELAVVIVALACLDGWLAYLLCKHGGDFKGRRS